MKIYKILSFILLGLLFFTFLACSNDDSHNNISNEFETLGVSTFKTITEENYIIELATKKGKLVQGYNEIYIRIQDQLTSEYVDDAIIEWTPTMYMVSMEHQTPKSEVTRTKNTTTLYNGYIMFQMAETTNPEQKWRLTVDCTIEEQKYSSEFEISVPTSPKKRVHVVTADDNQKYYVALVQPEDPIVGENELIVGLYAPKSTTSYPVVENYTLLVDPRMPDPGMGNHGSPNNVDLTYNSTTGFYHGKVNFTMTGLWNLNFQLKNEEETIIAGEEITNTSNPEGPGYRSSVYLEVEF